MERSWVVLEGIEKRFPGVTALQRVSMEIGRGEVVGLVGENGAGKSTLMNILGGILLPDAGEVRLDGRPVRFRSVGEAIRHGIAFIHQELNVLDNLDVAANVFLGREPVKGGWINWVDRRTIEEETRRQLERLGMDLSPRTPLWELSLAQQQMVEIAKALSQDARLLIMDEPTSCLTMTETERLLRTVMELKTQGVSVVFITHRLSEIQRCADRVVVLRDGCNAGELKGREIQHDALIRLMVGRDLKDLFVNGRAECVPDYFRVRGIRTSAYPSREVDLSVSRGEIFGLAGLVGAGRSEVARAVFGVDRPLAGTVVLGGQTLSVGSPREAIREGIYLVPEDRRHCGLVTRMSVRENVTLGNLARLSRLGLINETEECRIASTQSEQLKIKTPTVEETAGNLSGGNQQKVVLAKWLSRSPRVIIFDEPTRGIDVGAKAEIYHLMRELAERGVVVIMISSDMEEILGVSDRIAVMHEGAVTGVLDRPRFSEETVMRLAVGQDC